MSSFLGDLMAGLAQFLEDQGVGSFNSTGAAYASNAPSIYFDVVPASPDRVIVLTPYGASDDPSLSETEVAVQVRVRGTKDPRTAYELDDKAFEAFQNVPRTVMGGVTVVGLWRTSSAYMGVDANGRHERTSNYAVRVHRPSPHRI